MVHEADSARVCSGILAEQLQNSGDCQLVVSASHFDIFVTTKS